MTPLARHPLAGELPTTTTTTTIIIISTSANVATGAGGERNGDQSPAVCRSVCLSVWLVGSSAGPPREPRGPSVRPSTAAVKAIIGGSLTQCDDLITNDADADSTPTECGREKQATQHFRSTTREHERDP